MSAKLRYHYGVVGASKSTFLLTTAHSFEERGIPFICIKSDIDVRDGIDVISSKIGIKRNCTMFSNDINLFEWFKAMRNEWISNCLEVAKWIFVDEVQFMTPRQIEQLAMIVDSFDVNVMCFGLRTDFTTELFPASKRLLELADEVEEIKMSCQCGEKAIINARINDSGTILTSGEQIMLGGNDMYIPLCRSCYYKAIVKNNRKKC